MSCNLPALLLHTEIQHVDYNRCRHIFVNNGAVSAQADRAAFIISSFHIRFVIVVDCRLPVLKSERPNLHQSVTQTPTETLGLLAVHELLYSVRTCAIGTQRVS